VFRGVVEGKGKGVVARSGWSEVVKASFTASDAVKEAFTPLRTALNDAFGTLNVLNAPFRTSQQPDTSASTPQ